MKFKEFLLYESKESREAMKRMNLKYIGYGYYKDYKGKNWVWNSKLKRMEIKEVNDIIETYKDFKNIIYKLVNQLWVKWKGKYPDDEELKDPEYMYNEIKRNYAHTYFIAHAIKSHKVIKGSKTTTKAIEKTIGKCYYNALDNSIRNDYDLAYGFVLEDYEMKKLISSYERNERYYLPHLLHVFNIKNNKVIDPTLGKNNDIYFYKIIPKNIVKKLSKFHKFNDSEQDARKLDDYIEKELDYFIKDDLLKDFKNFINKNKG